MQQPLPLQWQPPAPVQHSHHKQPQQIAMVQQSHHGVGAHQHTQPISATSANDSQASLFESQGSSFLETPAKVTVKPPQPAAAPAGQQFVAALAEFDKGKDAPDEAAEAEQRVKDIENEYAVMLAKAKAKAKQAK
eukprot:1018194-Pyramimonas_sp.AAC.1